MTAPPCDEVVTWLVLQDDSLTLSPQDIDTLVAAFGNHTNNRPTQLVRRGPRLSLGGGGDGILRRCDWLLTISPRTPLLAQRAPDPVGVWRSYLHRRRRGIMGLRKRGGVGDRPPRLRWSGAVAGGARV